MVRRLWQSPVILVSFLGLAALAACGDTGTDIDDESVADESPAETAQASHGSSAVERGKRLFKKEEFDGNGRTCSTCHRGNSRTLSPEKIQEIYECDPDDPLFADIDSDDGAGESFDRLLTDATIRIILPLPPTLRPLDDLEATEIVLNRGIPTSNNVALDDVFDYDGRAEDLQSQALGAIHAHTENGREPTAQELDDIAAFEESEFSSNKLKAYANGGPPPKLPDGRTASEKRGRAFFEPDRFCGGCHSGPMLNETSEFHFLGPGVRFEAIFAGELDLQTNPIRDWAIVDPDTHEIQEIIDFPFPDPGRALATGDPADVTNFKIPTVWGVKDTAPYFHDASAKTLEDLMEHYSLVHEIFQGEPLSDQDQKDIIRFMKLL